MTDEDYGAYAYSRYRKPKRIFIYIMIPVLLVTIFFVSNLIFGFIDFGKVARKNPTVTMQSFDVYATEDMVSGDKSRALQRGVEIKNSGGAGYLHAKDGGWAVINNIGMESVLSPDGLETNLVQTKYSTRAEKINLVDKAHHELVLTLANTFQNTFTTLLGYLASYQNNQMAKQEIIDNSRLGYNNLMEMVTQFESFENWNDDYTKLKKSLTAELFGLSVISLQGQDENFAHVLKNACSWVAFAVI